MLTTAFDEWYQEVGKRWTVSTQQLVSDALEKAKQATDEERAIEVMEKAEEAIKARPHTVPLDPQELQGFLDSVLLSLEGLRGKRATTGQKAKALADAIKKHQTEKQSHTAT